MTTHEILAARIHALTDEINAQYWVFSRCARGKPVDPKLTRARAELQSQQRTLRRLGPTGFDANGSPVE